MLLSRKERRKPVLNFEKIKRVSTSIAGGVRRMNYAVTGKAS
jgi:hypothetical protein